MSAKYKLVNKPSHPLATKCGNLPEHRIVLYNKIGPGPHNCQWCGDSVTWRVGARTAGGALVVDHLDEDARNNDPDNLVPSCHACNCFRNHPHAIKDGVPLITRKDGTRHQARAAICPTCVNTFLVEISDQRTNRGLYCSRSCARRAPRTRLVIDSPL